MINVNRKKNTRRLVCKWSDLQRQISSAIAGIRKLLSYIAIQACKPLPTRHMLYKRLVSHQSISKSPTEPYLRAEPHRLITPQALPFGSAGGDRGPRLPRPLKERSPKSSNHCSSLWGTCTWAWEGFVKWAQLPRPYWYKKQNEQDVC